MLANERKSLLDTLGRVTVKCIEELGYVFSLLTESLYWIVYGHKRKQTVHIGAVIQEILRIGVQAVPIISILCLAIGIMLAIQGIETLKTFGAQSQIITGIALSVTREFSPLIVSILVAGRSGSAIAARIATMNESQEIDALRVMGINPVRYLACPLMLAMMISIPCLTILGDFMGLLGGALYSSLELQINLAVYADRSLEVLSIDDIRQGLIKSVAFGAIIVLVGISNGFKVHGGAEGIGHVTTRSVVLSISCIIIADMIFTYFLNR